MSNSNYKFTNLTDKELAEFAFNPPSDLERTELLDLAEELADRLLDTNDEAIYWASEYKRMKQVVDRF